MRYQLPDWLAGQCDPAEAQSIEQALARDPVLEQEVHYLRSVLRYVDAAQLKQKYVVESAELYRRIEKHCRALNDRTIRYELPDYLAGQLPEVDSQALEQTLRSDPTLQRELEELKQVFEIVDRAQLSVQYESEARTLSVRVMEQWQQRSSRWTERLHVQWVLPIVILVGLGFGLWFAFFNDWRMTDTRTAVIPEEEGIGLFEEPIIFADIWYEEEFQYPAGEQLFIEALGSGDQPDIGLLWTPAIGSDDGALLFQFAVDPINVSQSPVD